MVVSTNDMVARALGFDDSKGESDYHVWGNVKSINTDGSYQVQLNTSSVTTRCAKGCNASVGKRVLVVIKRDGRAVAIAVLGGEPVVTGVKGGAESAYRKGNVNLTPENIGAAGANTSNGWCKITFPNGSQSGWLQTTQNGILPYSASGSGLGSWDYQFGEVRAVNVYRNNRQCFAGTVLYNNITGTNGTVYLSESVANFSWLRIFYRDNDWFKASIDVHYPQGTYGDLVITAKSPSGIFWTKHRTVSISGSAISSIRYGCYSVYGTSVGGNGDENTNNIWITAVIGYNT